MPNMPNASSASAPTSPQLAATLERALVYAEEQAHRQVTAEHLLLALTEDRDAIGILTRKGIDIDHMRNEVAGLVSGNNDRFEATEPGQPAYGADLMRVMNTAGGAASPRRPVDGALVLAALIADGTTPSAELIKLYGLTFDDITRLPPGLAAPAPIVQVPQQPPALASVRAAAREIALGQQRTRREFPAPPPQQTQPTGSTLRRPPASYPPPVPQPVPRDDYADGAAVNGHGGLNGYGADPPQAPAFRPAPAPQQVYAPPAPGWPGPAQPQPCYGYDPTANPADWNQYAYPEAEAGGFAEPAPAWTDGVPPDIAPIRQARRDPDSPPPPRQTPAARPQSQDRRPAGKGRRAAERSVIVENIPRQMVIGAPHIIEARIARHSIEGLMLGSGADGLANLQDLPTTLALTVRMRTPDGGVMIEAGSPETQWMESVLGLQQDDFASWRWTVTPKWSGATNLQLIASARAIDPAGLMSEMALPDHAVDVRIVTNFGALAGRSAFWIFLVVLLGGIGAIVESTMHIFSTLIGR